jgi:hypothetical protein
MKIALYKGQSRISGCIRWLTRSEYSHAALYFDDAAELAAESMRAGGRYRMAALRHTKPGSIVEAWDGVGVRNCASTSDGHSPGTPVDIYELNPKLTANQERSVIAAILPTLGEPYDWKNCLRCDPLIRGIFEWTIMGPIGDWIWNKEAWFCSELAFYALGKAGYDLLKRVVPDEVSPRDVAMSPRLEVSKVEITV